MSNLQINTRVRRLSYYLDDFEKGRIRIPLFQRDVVWNEKQKLKLFDSLKKGYPIGTILFWRPEKNEEIENIDFELDILGSYHLNEKDSDFFYILDGYQRLSTLLNCLTDPKSTTLERDDEIWYKEFSIYYDLSSDEFKRYKGSNIDQLEVYEVPLFAFADSINFYNFQEALSKEDIDDNTKKKYLQRYKNIGSVFNDYLIPSIDLIGGNITEAIEIFNRVNSEGTKIKDDWKLSALTINNEFRLGTLISEAIQKIESINFYPSKKRESFKDKFIFKTIQSSFGPLYLDTKATDVKTLSEKDNFSEMVKLTLDSCVEVVKFLKEELLILDLKYLPANLHFIFLVQFFNLKGKPFGQNIEELKKWFWKTTYANYFTVFNPSKRKKAFQHFLNYTKGIEKKPFYYDEDIKEFSTEKFPSNIDFGGVRKIALALFMVNYSLKKKALLDSHLMNINEVKGIHELKLFRNEKSTENTVFIVEKDDALNRLVKNKKVLSFLLSKEFEGQFEELFITDSMRDEYEKGNIKGVLKLRKELIMTEEKDFVEKILKIKYSS